MTSLDPSPQGDLARREWREAPILPVAAAIGLAASVTHMYSAGVFIAPLHEEFGWSRTQITAGLSVASLSCGLLAPFLGSLIDRWGARRIGLPGLLFYCCTLAALALNDGSLWLWWGLWSLLALGALCINVTTWTTAVASRFNHSRGLALGVTLAGTGFAGAVTPILAAALLAAFGWRGAYLGLAAILAVVSLPMVFVFVPGTPYRQQGAGAGPRRAGQPHLPGAAVRQAMLSAQFIKLAIASLTVVIAQTAITLHMVPILMDRGFPTEKAAAAAGFIGIGSILGRLGTGFLLDKSNPVMIGAAAFSLPIAVVTGLLYLHHGSGMVFLLTFLLGVCVGGEIDVIAFLTARYFGIRNFGTLMGTFSGLQILAVGIGPVASGYIYDRNGSYDPVLAGVIPLFAFAAAMIASLWRAGPLPIGEPGTAPAAGSPPAETP